MSDSGYIRELLLSFMATGEDVVAFSIYDGEEKTDITYPHFAKDILKAVRYFVEHNIINQHIALVAPNSYEWLVTFFAILASGNVAVLLNPSLPKDMLQWQCEKADVSILCAEDSSVSELQSVVEHMRILTFTELKTAKPFIIEELHDVSSDKTILLMFTSGTTGKSKIVQITSDNLQYSIESMHDMFAVGNMDCAISTVPLYHIAGLRGGIAMLYHHKKLCMGRGIKYLLMDIPVFNPTYILLVPAMVENIVKILKRIRTDAERKKYIGSRLKRICIGGAALKSETSQFLIDMGFVLDNAYALTETTGDGTWCVIDMKHAGSIGKPCGDMQCCIKDGEILMKGTAVMKGYYKDPEETAKVIKDGWLCTGDMGYCDEDGYYYITGRKKNVIILSNGENVNPEEIEAKFYECESILECMVYSDGKGICADVYTENEEAAVQYIRGYNEGMPMYRQVYKVNYSAVPLEKTGSGKIKRKENV